MLTVGWIVGEMVGDGGPLGFKASALLLAAAAIVVSVVAVRNEPDVQLAARRG